MAVEEILFICGNQGVVFILRKGRSKCPYLIKLMRKLILSTPVNGFYFSGEFIKTKHNFLADPFSRFQVGKLKELNPEADAQQLQFLRQNQLLWN